ncbi:hypothetical protein B0H17DRAFT_1246155 [Mycena rosella]|uniref:Uncharacterized protein n=1 Tax=Mycena rosella TaxID=1033263 RepID=A0AAD7CZ41_MYCRO|nr:hypothetical protein B0H17DRAFT_1246155 [Mycena rosella]
MQGILKLSIDNPPTPKASLPTTQRVRRVAFHGIAAAPTSKPTSNLQRAILKGEWSMCKRPPQVEPRNASSARKTRLVELFLSRLDRKSSHKPVPGGARVSSGWGYFARNIVYTKPRPRIFAKPRKMPTAPAASKRQQLKRKPNFPRVYSAGNTSSARLVISHEHRRRYRSQRVLKANERLKLRQRRAEYGERATLPRKSSSYASSVSFTTCFAFPFPSCLVIRTTGAGAKLGGPASRNDDAKRRATRVRCTIPCECQAALRCGFTRKGGRGFGNLRHAERTASALSKRDGIVWRAEVRSKALGMRFTVFGAVFFSAEGCWSCRGFPTCSDRSEFEIQHDLVECGTSLRLSLELGEGQGRFTRRSCGAGRLWRASGGL